MVTTFAKTFDLKAIWAMFRQLVFILITGPHPCRLNELQVSSLSDLRPLALFCNTSHGASFSCSLPFPTSRMLCSNNLHTLPHPRGPEKYLCEGHC